MSFSAYYGDILSKLSGPVEKAFQSVPTEFTSEYFRNLWLIDTNELCSLRLRKTSVMNDLLDLIRYAGLHGGQFRIRMTNVCIDVSRTFFCRRFGV